MEELFNWKPTEEEYRTCPAVNFHTLLDFHRDPRAFAEGFFNNKEETPAMAFGTALHMLVLEPQAFIKTYAVFEPPINSKTGAPYGASTNAYKEAKEQWVCQNTGKILLSDADYKTLLKLSDSYIFHAEARRLMKDVITTEQSVRAMVQVCEEPRISVNCKGRIDAITSEGIVDLKTTAAFDDVSGRDKFRHAIYEYKYIIQLAFYRLLLTSVGYQGDMRCWLIAFEKQEPNRVAVYALTDPVIDLAEQTVKQWLCEWYASQRDSNYRSKFDTLQIVSSYNPDKDA